MLVASCDFGGCFVGDPFGSIPAAILYENGIVCTVCMYRYHMPYIIEHWARTGMVANPVRGQLNREH